MAFGNMNERGTGRLGGSRPAPAAPATPVLPAPSAQPAKPGKPRPNVATEVPMTPRPARTARANPNAAPDPQRDPLPPQFANMVAGGMSEAQARQKWTRSLTNRGKIGPATTPTPATPGKPTAPAGPVAGPSTPVQSTPTSPFVPGPSPSPGTPVFGGFNGPVGGGGYGGEQDGGYGGRPQIGPGSPIAPGGQDFRDPMMSFLSAVPLMNLNASKQIDSALSQFGGDGNRWSTAAQNAAGQIGAENALAQNSMFTNMLGEYANNQENRALQASGMGMQLGQIFDQQAQDRVRLPFELGAYEQGRQDNLARQYYDDYEANKLGWLPMMLQAASGQSGGSQGTLVPIPGQAAKPGIADYATLFAQLFG